MGRKAPGKYKNGGIYIDRKVFQKVEERSEGYCEYEQCKIWGGKNLHKHHAFNGANRRKMEMEETVFDLCWEHHEGNTGVHRNRELDLHFKKLATKNLINLGWSKAKIIKEVGRYYLDE